MTFSIKGRILLFCFAAITINTALVTYLLSTPWPKWVVIPGALIVALLVLMTCLQRLYRPIESTIRALETGVSGFKDKDFSITIEQSQQGELDQVVAAFNKMATTLRDERMSLFQRELLLDTIIQSTTVAIILTDEKGFVIYANGSAKDLFQSRQKPLGQRFEHLLAHLPEELRSATEAMQSGLINLQIDGSKVAYYLSSQVFHLNAKEHRLYLYKNLSSEISRQEIALWKNAIRLISHELNNSLAPIASLANSAKKIITTGNQTQLLPELIDTISRRTSHLNSFLSSYAEFARLPAPKVKAVAFNRFVDDLLAISPYQVPMPLPDVNVEIDTAQMEQVLINLYKNAIEAGSSPEQISLAAEAQPPMLRITITDQGTGMTEQQLQQALLPFFSTKQKGTGLGLSLCNEIVSAHDGQLHLQNRPTGGLQITLLLPMQNQTS